MEAQRELPSKARPAGPWQSSGPHGLPRRCAPRNDDGFDRSFVPQSSQEQKMLEAGKQIAQEFKSLAEKNLGNADSWAKGAEKAVTATAWAKIAGELVALAEMGVKWA
jgi:hypothetical protein